MDMLKNLALKVQPCTHYKNIEKIINFLPQAVFFFSGVIFSRGILLRELYPFGVGFLGGICLGYPTGALAALLGCMTGYLTVLPFGRAILYILSLCCLYVFLFRSGQGQDHPLAGALFASIFHVLIHGIYLLIIKGTLYQGIVLALEGVFVCTIIIACRYAARGYSQWKSSYQLNLEARYGFAVLLLGLLLGTQDLTFCGLDVQSMLCRYILLWAACIGGPGTGAAAGVAVGLLPVFQGNVPLGSVTFYAAAGLLAGSFRAFHKAGAVVGFVLANLFLAVYYTQPALIWRTLMETAVAAAFFCLLPVPWEDWQLNDDGLPAAAPVEDSQERLARLGEAFLEIQNMLASRAEYKEPEAGSEELIARVACQVCEGCSLWQVCWKQNRKRTEEIILECGRRYHEAGKISEKNLDPELLRRCPRSRELAVAVSNQVEYYALMRYYKRKLEGGRIILAQQLSGLGSLIQELSAELGSLQQLYEERRLLLEHELRANNLPVQKVLLTEVREGSREMRIIQSPCKDRKRCREVLLPLAAKSLGIPHEIRDINCPVLGGERCSCVLAPKAILEIEIGQALCPKPGQKISGDTAAIFRLPGREIGLAISDGMGTGLEAHKESALALKLLERFLQTGLTSTMALKIVNAAMLLSTNQESFATLDLVIINQVTGETEFIKAGGAPSLIWSDGRFQVITAGMPPAGILDQFEPRSFTKVLYPQDVVISMSDGAWEALEALEGRGEWLDKLMQYLAQEKAEKIAEYLLYLAQNGQKEIADDMCIQVARIGKRNIA